MALRISRISVDDTPAKTVSWTGPFLSRASLALVNRKLVEGLERLHPSYKLELRPHRSDDGSLLGVSGFDKYARRLAARPGDADVHVRHHWPPDWTRPSQGRFIAIQPWEYGALPLEWVKGAANADEIWVHTEFVRKSFVESGVPERKVVLIPLGVDPGVYNPQVAPGRVPSEKGFKFLFVGGTIRRKGIDLLLQAYCDEFTADDDVSLIVKDFGVKTFYRNQEPRSLVTEAMSLAGGPEIVYMDDEMTDADLAGLYRACDCLTHPYRGEGFGLTVVEAMACGLPVIVTGYGACLDFCNDENAYLIQYDIQWSEAKSISGQETVGYPHLAEPRVEDLRRCLRRAYENREEAREKGSIGSRYVLANLTWAVSARRVDERLRAFLADDDRPTIDVTSAKDEGVEAFQTGRLAEARELLQAAVDAGETDGYVLNALAVSCDRLGDMESAKAVLARAIKLYPDSPSAYRSLAALLARDGRVVDALGQAVTALELDHANRESYDMVHQLRDRVRSAPRGKSKKGNGGRLAVDALLSRASAAMKKAGSTAPREEREPTLSLCMIVKDEEEFLPECLESVRGVVDEVIVVDTGSTDSTVSIASSYGAKVFAFQWIDDFAAARNESLAHATGDWILMLDADERLSEGSGEIIRAAIRSNNADAYNLKIRNYISGDSKSGEVTMHRNTRMHRRRPEYRYVGRVHELVTQSITDSGGSIAFLDATIDHYGYLSETVKKRGKYERNKALIEASIDAEPENPFHWHNMGMLYSSHRRHDEAIPYLQKAVSLLTPSHAFARSTYAQLANAYRICRRPDEAVETARRGESLGLGSADLSLCMGNALVDLARYEEASAAYRSAYGRPSNPLADADLGASGYKACCGAATAYMGMGKHADAIEWAERAVSLKPDDPTAYRILVDVCGALGRTDDVERHMRSLARCAEADPQWRIQLGDLLMSQESFAAAAEEFGAALRMGADSPGLRRSLASCALSLDDADSAEEHLRALVSMAPDDLDAQVALGSLLGRSGRLPQAMAVLAEVIESAPDHPTAYFATADIMYAAGEFQGGVQACEQGLIRLPSHAPGYLLLGNCYYRMGAYAASVMAYRQALTLDPGLTDAANNLRVAEGAASE